MWEGKGPATHGLGAAYLGQNSLEGGVLSNAQWVQTHAQVEAAEGEYDTAPEEDAQGQPGEALSRQERLCQRTSTFVIITIIFITIVPFYRWGN